VVDPQPTADERLFETYLALSHVISVAPDSPLAPLPGEAPEQTPRFYVARTTWGAWRSLCASDLPAGLTRELTALEPARALREPEVVLRIFSAHRVACDTTWLGRTSRFPALSENAPNDERPPALPLPAGIDVYGEKPPSDWFSTMPGDVTSAGGFTPRQFAILADGLAVTTCESSRESLVAAEAWVRTLPQYRGRGYATRATAAWARDARRRGKEPFYSHHRENAASEGVARALGLLPFLEDAGYL
jgi:hypothetical protein